MSEQEKSRKEIRIGIIGSGISGLSAAWELSGWPRVHTDVYERDPKHGGLAGWFDIGGTTLEKFYHHIYRNYDDLIQLIQEMGLGDNLVFKTTNTAPQ